MTNFADLIRARLSDIRRGAVIGFAVGLALAALRLLGHDRGADYTVEDQAASVATWCTWFVLGSPISGAIAGLLRPFSVSWIGAGLVGMVAAVPMAVGADLFLLSGSPIDRVNLVTAGIGAVLLGGSIGLAVYFAPNPWERRQ